MAANVAADLFQFECSALPKGTRVAAFRGREAMSEFYRFEIGLLVPAGEEVDLDAAIAQRGKLFAKLADGQQTWNGIIARIDLVHAWAERSLYRVVLAPEFWIMANGQHSRVAVDISVSEIIEKKLKLYAPAEFEMRLKGTYSKRSPMIEYRESHYSFVSRWMERRGMYFFFEQSDDKEKLIVTDNKGTHVASRTDPARYVPLSGSDTMAIEAFDSFICTRTARDNFVQFRDYNHQTPQVDNSAKADILPADKGASVDIWADHYGAPAVAQHLADDYAEADLANKKVFHGHGRVFQLRTGFKFTLEGHPLDSMNKEYLVTALEHEGNLAADGDVRRLLGITHPDEYRVTVTAIEGDVQYRRERVTPWPRVSSTERGWVDGPDDSPYAQLDEEGRYKVQIGFDQATRPQTPAGGNASAWVRMMQPHGGKVEGFHMPLRRGTEVILGFLAGDPDQPFIAGVVADALRVSPVTSDNHTLNVIQTGGKNRFEMQDQDGKQYIDISTPPKDTRIHLGEPHDKHGSYIVFNTGGDQFVNIGGPRHIEVGGKLHEHVKGDVKWDHDSHRDDTVGAGVTEKYTGNHLTTVTAIRSEHVGGNYFENYGAKLDTIVASDVSEQYGGNQTTAVTGNLTYGAVTTKFNFADTTFTFADTTLKFGPTHLNWGATDGKVASINISVPGGSTITTPSWKIVNPNEDWLGAISEWKWAKKLEVTGLKTGINGIKMEGNVLALAFSAFKGDTKGIDLTQIGVKKKDTGPTINVLAVFVQTTTVNIFM